MRPRLLRQFLAICRHGTMSGAARELGIAQPALSKQMSQLEHELDAQLFQRHSRGVTLTRAGEKLRQEAAELIRKDYADVLGKTKYSMQKLVLMKTGGGFAGIPSWSSVREIKLVP